MALALDGIPLLVLLIFAVLWVLASTTKLWLAPVLGALHDALGWIPFVGDLIGAAEAAIIGVLNDAIAGLEQAMTDLWAGIVWSWNQFLSANEELAHALWKVLDHAWNVALPDAFNDARTWVTGQTNSLSNRLDGLTVTLRDDFSDAKNFATTEAEHALSKATAYADSVGTATYDHARTYVDDAVAKLSAAENAAIASAVAIANTAEKDAAGALAQAETYVDSITAPIGKDLADFENYVKGLGLPAALAGLVGLSTLVTAIATESGLDNAACRSKVKGICGTDPAAWENLLLGITAIGVAFNLQDIVDAASAIFTDASDLIQAAA